MDKKNFEGQASDQCLVVDECVYKITHEGKPISVSWAIGQLEVSLVRGNYTVLVRREAASPLTPDQALDLAERAFAPSQPIS